MTIENSPAQNMYADRIDAMSNALVAMLPVLAALTYFAVTTHLLLAGHLHEDAYILFTYVENIASGNGFTFFADGPRTEGATDFLWTITLAAAARLDIDAGVAAAALNAIGIAVLCRVALHFIPEDVDARMRPVLATSVAVLVTVSPVASSGIGGFSGPFFSAFAVLLFAAYLRERYDVLPWGGLLLGLIRPEGVIIGGAYAMLGLAARWRQPGRNRYVVQLLLAAAVGCAYFTWRTVYFGHLLPLPLYVKSSGLTVFPGIESNLDWLTFTLPLISLAATVVLHDAVDRRRLGLAVLPILLLLVSLCFARQLQNVDYRFQAPATAVAIVIATISAGHWIRRASHLVASGAIICTLAMSLPAFVTMFDFNVRYLEDWHYDNYLPYHLAASTNDKTTIALTEAGRMAYWTRGKKVDLVGLNTAYPAIHSLDLAYLEKVRPDMLYMDTVNTLPMQPYPAANFVIMTTEELLRKSDRSVDWRNEINPVRRAPLVVFDYLERHPDDFNLVVTGPSNGFRHVYAIRKDGAIAYRDFLAALRKSFSAEGELSYWEMKRRRARPPRQSALERAKGIEPSS